MESHTHEVTNQDLLKDVFPFIQTHEGGYSGTTYVIRIRFQRFLDCDGIGAPQRKYKSVFNSECKGKFLSMLINPSLYNTFMGSSLSYQPILFFFFSFFPVRF